MIVITSATCAPCAALKRAHSKNPELSFVDIASEYGQALSSTHAVRTVPTLITAGGHVVNGAPAIDQYLRKIKK